MKIRSKFWLADDQGQTVFGDGRAKMLELIKEHGSMQAAAKSLGMSYRGVWGRIKATEERLGLKLVETSVGHGQNRGSRLTPEAERLLANFQSLNQQGLAKADELYARIFESQAPVTTEVVPAVAIVGPPAGGKRELIGRLVEAWGRRSRKVGVIRTETRSMAEETEGVSDWMVAGAVCVIRLTSDRIAIDFPSGTDLTPETLAANYALGADLVLVESSERVHLPTIEVYRQDIQEKPLTRQRKHLLAVVGDRPADKPDWPHFPLSDLDGLIDLVEGELGSRRMGDEVKLSVNGRRVPMLPFVQDIMANTLWGLVSSLKSCHDPYEIEVKVRRSGPALKAQK